MNVDLKNKNDSGGFLYFYLPSGIKSTYIN